MGSVKANRKNNPTVIVFFGHLERKIKRQIIRYIFFHFQHTFVNCNTFLGWCLASLKPNFSRIYETDNEIKMSHIDFSWFFSFVLWAIMGLRRAFTSARSSGVENNDCWPPRRNPLISNTLTVVVVEFTLQDNNQAVHEVRRESDRKFGPAMLSIWHELQKLLALKSKIKILQ